MTVDALLGHLLALTHDDAQVFDRHGAPIVGVVQVPVGNGAAARIYLVADPHMRPSAPPVPRPPRAARPR
jgi:hypothetical protein